MKIEPYFSIDIETTGLNVERSEILEIGCVYDDGVTDIDNLPRFTSLVKAPLRYVEYGAMAMHSELLKKIIETKPMDILSVITQLEAFIKAWSKNDIVKIAGANASGFDLPILKRYKFNIPVHHRIIDIGSVYFAKFGKAASTCEIQKLVPSQTYTHHALDDALFVVHALRHIVKERAE